MAGGDRPPCKIEVNNPAHPILSAAPSGWNIFLYRKRKRGKVPVQVSAASWRTSLQLRRMRALLWGKVVETKLRELERAIKANFDPNQPRVPAGNPDGGQWTGGGGGDAGGGGGEDSRASTDRQPSGVLLASFTPGGPGDDPPKIPKKRPPTSRGRTRIYKEAARWLARAVLKETVEKRIAAFLTILDEAGWLEPAIDSIRTFADPPKSLEELQQAVSTSAPGYDIHHIVEQTSAEQDGSPRSMIDAPDWSAFRA